MVRDVIKALEDSGIAFEGSSLLSGHIAAHHIFALWIETLLVFFLALPMLHEVHCSTNVPRSNEPLTLSCKIHSYFPETLEVCWNNDDGILDSSFSTPPTKGADGLYFCISKIHYNPQVEDSGKRFVCRAKLEGSQAYKESAWQMDIVGKWNRKTTIFIILYCTLHVLLLRPKAQSNSNKVQLLFAKK